MNAIWMFLSLIYAGILIYVDFKICYIMQKSVLARMEKLQKKQEERAQEIIEKLNKKFPFCIMSNVIDMEVE